MTNINIGKKELIHFIGIGGIGMSGLAQIMKIMDFNVQGSDLNKNKNVKYINLEVYKDMAIKELSKIKNQAITFHLVLLSLGM